MTVVMIGCGGVAATTEAAPATNRSRAIRIHLAPQDTSHKLSTHSPTDPRSTRTVLISTGSGSDHYEAYEPHSIHSSRSSASVLSPTSSGGYTSESWDHVEVPDDIDPSDSASRARHGTARRAVPDVHIPPTRQQSTRRAAVDRDERSRRHHGASHRRHSSRHRSESRQTPSEDSAELNSYADFYGYHGLPHAPPPPQRGYPPAGYRSGPAPPQSHGGYPPTVASPYHDPYSGQALVHMSHDPYGYGHNPFAQNSHTPNPFMPMSNSSSSNYFSSDPHAAPGPPPPSRPAGPPRPQSYVGPASHFPGSELMSYASPVAYPPYGIPGAFPGWAYPPPGAGKEKEAEKEKEKPKEEPKPDPELMALKALLQRQEDARLAEEEHKRALEAAKPNPEIESLKALIKSHEEARLKAEAERVARAEAEAAAAALKKAEEAAEKLRKDEIAAASKSAKEAAEKAAEEAAKKTKEEADKALAEAKKAHEEAEAKKKELEEEIAKNKPPPDMSQPPIRFKDALGRKFTFPWHLCKTWKGMEALIRQAFVHIEGIGDHVLAGHYDLTGSDQEILLPQVWETMIKPDAEISMHLWPGQEPEPPPPKDRLAAEVDMLGGFHGLGLGDLGMMEGMMHGGMQGGHGGERKRSKKSGKESKKKSKAPMAEVLNVGQMGAMGMGPMGPMGMPPPPPDHGGGASGMLYDQYLAPAPTEKKRTKSKSKSKDVGPLMWLAGAGTRRKK